MNGTGSVLIVTEHGLIANGNSSKSEFWIPSDKYQLKYNPNETANINENLEKIKIGIIDGSFDFAKVSRISIPQAHQLKMGASSPCNKTGCKCSNGRCSARCGCIRSNQSCNSRCSCSGSCARNELNDCNRT